MGRNGNLVLKFDEMRMKMSNVVIISKLQIISELQYIVFKYRNRMARKIGKWRPGDRSLYELINCLENLKCVCL